MKSTVSSTEQKALFLIWITWQVNQSTEKQCHSAEIFKCSSRHWSVSFLWIKIRKFMSFHVHFFSITKPKSICEVSNFGIYCNHGHVMESSQRSISTGTVIPQHSGMSWNVTIVWEWKEPIGQYPWRMIMMIMMMVVMFKIKTNMGTTVDTVTHLRLTLIKDSIHNQL